MYRNALWYTALAGVAFLFIIPNFPVCAGTLRDEAVTYREQGYELQRRGDKAGALALYQKAAELDRTYPTPYNDMGVIFEDMGRLDEAEHAYQNALSLHPDYLDPHTNLALLYERKGEREKAIYHWMKRFQLGDPTDAWTARAEERLVALGVFKTHPGLKGKIYTRRRIVGDELQAHAQSLDDFHAVTQEHRDWP